MPKKVERYNEDVESFLKFAGAIKTKATKQSYTYSLNEFMRFAKFKNYDDLASLETNDLQDLLEKWVMGMKKKNLKYKTIATKLDSVELFLDMNKKIWFRTVVRKMLPANDHIPGGSVPFTTEELWEMKKIAKHPRDKAIIDFLASTGARPGVLSDPILRKKHVVDMSHDCKAVKLYDESKEGYWAFLTPEASKSLVNYLGWRQFNHEKIDDDSVLFRTFDTKKTKKEHMTNFNVRRVLEKLMRQAGIERKKTDNRYDKAVIVGFRKRFNGILKMNNEVNSNIAEKLMAHKKGLDGTYLKPTKEQCFKEFLKAVPELTLDPDQRQKELIEKQGKKIDELQAKTNTLKEVLRRLDELEGKMTHNDELSLSRNHAEYKKS